MTAVEALPEVLRQLERLPESPPELQRLRLWSHPLALAAVVGLLGLFWAGRKWQGLL